VRKYSPDGAELWTRQFGSPDVDRATAITVDATGVYVVGTTNGEFVRGRSAQQDGFLAKFGKDGRRLSVEAFGTTDHNEEANAVRCGPLRYLYGGRTTGALEGEIRWALGWLRHASSTATEFSSGRGNSPGRAMGTTCRGWR
jgi:hypothetical protein